MTKQEFRKEIARIIIVALRVKNPTARGYLLVNHINGLCEKLNF